MTEQTIQNNLETKVEYSRMNVLRGWVQNLKDDIDPAIKGAKLGFLGLHGVPTLIRQYKEGKMSTDRWGLSGLLGLVVAGTFVSGYAAAGKHICDETNSDLGYAMIGVPITGQLISWGIEALFRAQKTEQSKVVMTKLERSFNATPTEQYDVTNQQLLEIIANKLYQLRETEVKERIEGIKYQIDTVQNGKDVPEKRKQSVIEDYNAEIKNIEDELPKYKPRSFKHAQKGIFYVARHAFDGLVADNQLGKQYKMSADLQTGPVKRQRDKDLDMMQQDINDWDIDHEEAHNYRFMPSVVINLVQDTIKEVVKTKNGTAKTELFGTISSVYTNDGKEMHYEVTPNEIWRV